MSRINRLILWLLAALLLLLAGWYATWFYQNFERRYREERVDISPAAQRNPLLAAQRYLSAVGYRASSVQGRDLISNLPPAGDTLMLRQLPTGMDEQILYGLNDWIEAGGRLIVVPPADRYESDQGYDFLDDIGVHLRSFEYTDADDRSSEITIEQGSDLSDTDLIKIILPADDKPVVATFSKGYALEDRDRWASFSAGDQYGDRLLIFRIGQGQVAVLSDLELFTNDRIGLQDNAYLLNKLVHENGAVWLQYSMDMPGLPTLLWQKFPLQVSLMLVLLLLMGWRLLLYTGPQKTLKNTVRRDLMEHIDASASYAWRIDKGQQMLRDNREAVEQAWRRRHPTLNRMTEQQRCEWLAEITGMSASAIARTLYGDVEKELDFIKATLVLQQLTGSLKKRELG